MLYKQSTSEEMTRNNPNIVKQGVPLRNHETSAFHKVELVRNTNAFHDLREEWCSLNDASSKGNIFTSWDWLLTWWDVYQNDGNRQLFILQYRDSGGKLIGLAPFQIVNNPKKYFPCSRQIIMIGTGETDGSSVFGEYMDLLIVPGYESTVISAFSDYIFKNKRRWDGIKFHQVLANSHLSELFNASNSGFQHNLKHNLNKSVQVEGFRTIIELPETYKDYLMGLKKKMRNNITRTFSRLESEQEYTIDTIDNTKDADVAISILAFLNRSRRDNLEQPSAFEKKRFVEYHRKLSMLMFSRTSSNPSTKLSTSQSSSAVLRILRLDGEPVAALYSFIDGDTIHAYQSGFEKESGHRYSLLTTMLTQEISKSIENKSLKYFNFMYSDDESSYKKRYTGNSETMYKISFDKESLRFKLFQLIHGPVKVFIKKLMRV